MIVTRRDHEIPIQDSLLFDAEVIGGGEGGGEGVGEGVKGGEIGVKGGGC